ncbi:MAG: hypothetical protein ABMA64_16545 [Myxococcota bacterium]
MQLLDPVDPDGILGSAEAPMAGEINGRAVVLLPDDIWDVVHGRSALESTLARLSTGGRIGAFAGHSGGGGVAYVLWAGGQRVRTLVSESMGEHEDGDILDIERAADAEIEGTDVWIEWTRMEWLLADLLGVAPHNVLYAANSPFRHLYVEPVPVAPITWAASAARLDPPLSMPAPTRGPR